VPCVPLYCEFECAALPRAAAVADARAEAAAARSEGWWLGDAGGGASSPGAARAMLGDVRA